MSVDRESKTESKSVEGLMTDLEIANDQIKHLKDHIKTLETSHH